MRRRRRGRRKRRRRIRIRRRSRRKEEVEWKQSIHPKLGIIAYAASGVLTVCPMMFTYDEIIKR